MGMCGSSGFLGPVKKICLGRFFFFLKICIFRFVKMVGSTHNMYGKKFLGDVLFWVFVKMVSRLFS